jgi:hypothetical protein
VRIILKIIYVNRWPQIKPVNGINSNAIPEHRVSFPSVESDFRVSIAISESESEFPKAITAVLSMLTITVFLLGICRKIPAS